MDTSDIQPVASLLSTESCPSNTSPNGSLQTTPKLPKRERLASFSRLVTSENFTDIMPDKVTSRKNRAPSKKIIWNPEDLPEIRISNHSSKLQEKAENRDGTANFKGNQYSGLQPLPFSPNFPSQSPKYASPAYQQSTPMRSPLYVPEQKRVYLGRGSFGNVTLCNYRGKKFALKVTGDKSSYIGEYNFLNIRHPHLVSVLHIATVMNEVFICMEFAGHCNLQQILDNKSELDFRRRLSFTIQIALGLRHCHQRQIVHGDVKPANVIVSPYGTCKLGDFGHSFNMNSFSDNRILLHEDIVGTAAYAAPEVLRGAAPSLSSDIYSFGILLWQVQTKEVPFAGEHPHVIIYKVANYGLRPEFTGFSQCSESYEKTAECCWNEDPFERLTVFDVLQKLRTIEKELKFMR